MAVIGCQTGCQTGCQHGSDFVGWMLCSARFLDRDARFCMRSAYPNKISNLGGAFFRAISTVYLSHL